MGGRSSTSLRRRGDVASIGVDNRSDIRDFLASRRARITPEQAGLLPGGGRRRVPGLRREEVAVLAGVSTEWYTRLEKGHIAGVSEDVLEAVARALQLDEAERTYLFDLARAAIQPVRTPRRRSRAHIQPRVQWMLDSMTAAAAFVANGRLDIVAANSLGRALLLAAVRPDPERQANLARFAFLDPRARRVLAGLARRGQRHGRRAARRRGPVPERHGAPRARRRTLDAERGVPHPVGPAQRPDPPQRRQAVPPPRRRRAGPRLLHPRPAHRGPLGLR